MLLVDDDQPDVGHRREDRRARADADPRLAARAAAPTRRGARPGESARVQDGDRVAEALDEARDDLRRQRDLGHEHDDAAAGRERRRRGLQVDLGLPRAGDAVQEQPRRRAPRPGSRRARRAGRPSGRPGRAARRARRPRRAAARGARRAGRASTSPRASRRRSAARSAPAKRGSVASSARWAAVRRSCGAGGRPAVAHSAVLARVPFGGSSSDSARAGVEHVSARHPQREVDELGRQPRVEHAPRRDDVVLAALGQPGDDAHDVAAPERDDEHRADRRRRRGARSRTARAARGPS